MIASDTLAFLTELRSNNHKDWFDENRKRYETAKKDFLKLATELLEGIEEFDEAVADAGLDPRKTLMRINRDIRFSKDKTPYNTHFFTYMSAGGKSSPLGGYFFSLSPEESFYGGGLYKPDNKSLNQIRPEIELHYEEWLEIVEGKALRETFGEIQSNETLKRPPKGFDADSPAIEWLKRKGFFVTKTVQIDHLQGEDLAKQVISDLKTVFPLIRFINEALSPS